MSANLCRVNGSFRPYQNEHNSAKDTGPGEKSKKPCDVYRKIAKKSCSTTYLPFISFNPKILKPFLKTFPTKMKPTNTNVSKRRLKKKKKKKRQEKRKKKGERKAKVNVMTAVSLLNPKTRNFAFCAFVDQKAAKCTTCKRLF